MEGVRIKRVDLRENVTAFYAQGHSNLSILMRCSY